jgi:hypothetical protein
MFNVINEMGALLWSQLIQKKKSEYKNSGKVAT